MQIRNLKEYITAISKKTSLENLWKSEGSFLSHIAGDKTNIKQYIGLITNFATHTGSQFFYELLQNADDAESDSVFIHFSPSAMVVINNGLPFYTDISEKGRKGQLLGFLQKQKGEKYDDPDSIGKNGQGSKLLYDLLLPVHDQKDKVSVGKENALQRAIIEEKKGPIIFSWREHTSFERLLTWNRGPFHPQSCDNDQHPLLTKIFYTCYPAMPGEELLNITGEKVCAFEHGELEFCVRYLNDIKHLFNQFKFYRGTLLFIPLGDRQYINLEKIHSNELIHGISTSLAFLKNLKEVKVIDKTFQKTSFNFRSIPSIESEDGNSFDISIAYPVDPRQEKYSFYNFFQFFPVTQTKFGLKYIINSKVYGIDGARQRIDLEYHRNIQAINAISLSIDEYINKCKEEEEKEDLVNLIKCLVCSDLPLLEQNPMIKDLLYDRPKRSIIENLPLVNGFADSIGGARVKNTGIDISPSDLGFEGWDWLTEDLQDYYDEIIEQLDIKPLTITDLLCECPDREKLDDWMDGLAEDIYLHLVAEVIESKGLKPIQGIPIARFSDGETYTLDEVLAEETLLLITPELAPLASILLSQGLVCGGKELFQNPQMAALIDSYGKFKKQEYLKRIIGAISPLQLERNDKWTVFKTLKKIVYAKSLLRDDLLLFENTGGEKRPFKKLMFDVSEIAPSGLLALYLLKASEFLNGEEMDTWLMQEDEIWDNLVEDWESIRPELDGELDFNQMVSEMSNIYQEVLLGIKLSSELPWIHTDTNEWSNSKSIFFSNQLKDYSPDDYTIQVKIVQLVTELKTIPYEYIATLDSIKFAELPNIGFARLKEKWGEHSLILGKRELTVFLKLKKTGEEFFENFLISSNEQPDSYIIELNDRKSKQYYSTDSILNEFLREKEKYYLLPQALFSIFNNTSSLQIEDENFASDLIGGFGAQEAFIDLVNRQSDQVKLQYLKALQRIDLYTDDGPNSYKNTFEGKVIDLICKKGWADTYRKKIYINNRPINEFNYNDRVEFYLDAEKKETKFEFSLASLIKKFEGISDTLSEVKKKLSGLSYKEIFSESEASPISDIPGQILPLDDEEQVAFLVSYYKSDLGSNSYNLERFKQRDFSAIDRGRLLSSFERHKIDFFSSFPLPEEWGLNLSVYLWPSDTILALDEERPKDWIIQWTQGGMPPDSRKKFLIAAGLNGDDSAVIKFRSNLLKQRHPEQGCIADLGSNDLNLVLNTINWAKTKLNWPVSPEGVIASAFHSLFQAFFQKEKRVILHFLMFAKEENDVKVSLKFFDKAQNSHLYIRKFDKESEEILPVALLHATHEVIDLTHEGYSDEFIQKIRGQGALECWLDKEISVQTGDPIKEWDDSRYDAWKEGAGKSYRIFLSSQELPVNYYLKISNGQQIPIGHFHKGDVDKKNTEEGTTHIYLHQKANNNIFKLLAEHQEKLFKGDEAVLVSLLAMNISSNQIISPTGKVDPQKPAYQFSHQISADEHDKLDQNLESITANLDAIKNMAELEVFDVISALLEKSSKEELEWLVANWDEIQLDKEKREPKPKPVALIGYIGERLVYLWIKSRIANHDGNSIEHVGIEVREYDVFLNYNRRPYCIEVKSTIKSIYDEDGMTPLFLRPRQYEFIKSNPDKNYVLSRISLQNIGLTHIYDRYKIRGKDLHEILELCRDEIDQHLSDFLNNPSSRTALKRGHMIFNMNIPKDGQEFWELFED